MSQLALLGDTYSIPGTNHSPKMQACVFSPARKKPRHRERGMGISKVEDYLMEELGAQL